MDKHICKILYRQPDRCCPQCYGTLKDDDDDGADGDVDDDYDDNNNNNIFVY